VEGYVCAGAGGGMLVCIGERWKRWMYLGSSFATSTRFPP